MAQTRDTKASTAPNIQDVFLNHARREKLQVVIRLMDGENIEARIKNFDRFAVIVDHEGTDRMIFKHAIATIRSPRQRRQLLRDARFTLMCARPLRSTVPSSALNRVIVIVLDSVGIGELPDAAAYGDAGQQHARQPRPRTSICTSRRSPRSA